MNKKLKGVLAVLLVLAIGAGAVFGIGYAARQRSLSGTVLVVSASELNYGGYWYGESSTEGMVTTDASQTVYLSDTEKVNAVLVTPGQSVNEGDVLMIYDKTETQLRLEKARLSRQSILINIDVAERNLATLSKLKPVAETPDDPGFDPEIEPIEDPDAGAEDPAGLIDGEGEAANPEDIIDDGGEDTEDPLAPRSVLDKNSIPANADEEMDEEGNRIGSLLNPYRFLCSDGCLIRASFLQMLKDKAMAEGGRLYYRLEVRRDDSWDGALLRAWTQDAAQLGVIPSDWVGRIDLSRAKEENEVRPKAEEPEADAESVTGTDAPADAEGLVGTAAKDDYVFSFARAEVKGSLSLSTSDMYEEEDGGYVDFAKGLRMMADTSLNYMATGLIPPDAQYTKDELARAKKDEEARLARLRLDLKESDLSVAKAEKAVNEGVVKAKFNGLVKTAGDPNSPPQDGSPFLEVVASEGLYIRSAVQEKNIGTVKEGDSASIMSWRTGMSVSGTIREISPYPDESGMFGYGGGETYYPMTIYVEDSSQLTNGDWVQVTLEQNGSAAMEEMPENDGRTLYLWKAFIREEAGSKYVWKRGEDGLLHKQSIVCGPLSGEGYEIISGVSMSDYLAFPYGKQLREGAKTREGTTGDLYSGL